MSEITEPRKISLVEMKARAQAKNEQDKEAGRIKRDILVLTLEFLRTNGYIDSCQKLQSESGVSLAKWQGADNIDLRLIISEFESFFKIKYGKQPRLVRKADSDDEPVRAGGGGVRQRPHTTIPSRSPDSYGSVDSSSYNNGPAAKHGRRASSVASSHNTPDTHKPDNSKPSSFGLDGVSIHSSAQSQAQPPSGGPRARVSPAQLNAAHAGPLPSIEGTRPRDPASQAADDDDGFGGPQQQLLRAPPQYTGELRELANAIGQDIYTQSPNCRWTDIIGLSGAKQLVQEAVVMPVRYPQLFTGLLAPWKGVLLYGPPGTGKTMLARAVATECKTTFFNISASSVVSKFRGDSEKLVRVLFELARHHAPSTIFLDEIDSIMGSRDAAGEHEASRRMKTELLVQMDGLSKSDDLVFVLAASNHPWCLDAALLRRLEKRIHVPLPSVDARHRILHTHLGDPERSSLTDAGLAQVAKDTPGYSGADIVLLCKEAAMRPVRRLMVQVREADKQRAAELARLKEEEDVRRPVGGAGKRYVGNDRVRQVMNDSEDVVRKMVAEAPAPEVQLDRITTEDVLAALNCTKPAANQTFLKRYEEWAKEHGNGFSEIDSDDDEPALRSNAEY